MRHAAFEHIDEDVRVGRNGVFGAGERLTGIGQHRACVVPGDFGSVSVKQAEKVIYILLLKNIFRVHLGGLSREC